MCRLPTVDGHDQVHGVSEQSVRGVRDARVPGEGGVLPLLPPPALPQVGAGWKGVLPLMVSGLQSHKVSARTS